MTSESNSRKFTSVTNVNLMQERPVKEEEKKESDSKNKSNNTESGRTERVAVEASFHKEHDRSIFSLSQSEHQKERNRS